MTSYRSRSLWLVAVALTLVLALLALGVWTDWRQDRFLESPGSFVGPVLWLLTAPLAFGMWAELYRRLLLHDIAQRWDRLDWPQDVALVYGLRDQSVQAWRLAPTPMVLQASKHEELMLASLTADRGFLQMAELVKPYAYAGCPVVVVQHPLSITPYGWPSLSHFSTNAHRDLLKDTALW